MSAREERQARAWVVVEHGQTAMLLPIGCAQHL